MCTLRTFIENVTTALDVIMSLGDLGQLTYVLKWYDSIGTAETVRSYWVESIDSDSAYARCGFVYESGSIRFNYSNHIHIPTDIRVLNSPVSGVPSPMVVEKTPNWSVCTICVSLYRGVDAVLSG